MACVEDEQPNFKHFCRVCRKGFMCGRALGGHMRAHGIGDEGGNVDDDDLASDWEDKGVGGDGLSNKRMYALRTNPNRLKSVRICENCGKEFFSWKSFLEHGKCGCEDAESLVSTPDESEEDDVGRRECGWSKRKRSFRAKVDSFDSNEDDDLVLAKCLMDLSNAREVEPEESCASASKEVERRNPGVAAYFAPLSRSFPLQKDKGVASKGMFECKACKKVFNSHQALGGHRASHKKVKGCFAARNDDQFEENTLADEDMITREETLPPKPTSYFQFDQGLSNTRLTGAAKRKSKVHKCSICNRIFASGQALGGHKRCHWLTSNSADTCSLVKYPQFHQHHSMEHTNKRVEQLEKSEALDLNTPAPGDDVSGIRWNPKNPLSFEVSTEINLQSWVNVDHINNMAREENNNTNIAMENVDDEADSKLKLAKLSELNDMNISGTSSPWLQVGIGSTTDVSVVP